jgi:hypothetical protein
MVGLALLIELAAIVTPADPRIPAPTLIVEDKTDIRQELETARDDGRRDRLRGILAHAEAYTWHCGGF